MNAPMLITTFSPAYWERLGRDSMETFVEFWPGPIVAYYENEKPDEFHGRVKYRNLYAQKSFIDFVDWTGRLPIFRGYMPDGSYRYQCDAHKFGRKVFAVTDPSIQQPFFFVGSDVRLLKPIPADLLSGMLNGKAGAFLFRDHIEKMHIESDFAGYNPLDEGGNLLLNHYRQAFINGTFLTLPEWHDCTALDMTIKMLKLRDRCTDITNGAVGDGEHHSEKCHVWPKTVLAEYAYHPKGKRAKRELALKGAA